VLHRHGEQVVVFTGHHGVANRRPIRITPPSGAGSAAAEAEDHEGVAVLANQRDDGLGGSRAARHREALLVGEVIQR
jgi:hypothetical protein